MYSDLVLAVHLPDVCLVHICISLNLHGLRSAARTCIMPRKTFHTVLVMLLESIGQLSQAHMWIDVHATCVKAQMICWLTSEDIIVCLTIATLDYFSTMRALRTETGDEQWQCTSQQKYGELTDHMMFRATAHHYSITTAIPLVLCGRTPCTF